MDNQTKVILGLLVLIAILIGIFTLKVTGVIKPSEKEPVKTEDIHEIQEAKETENFIFSNEKNFIIKVLGFFTMYAIAITIIMFIVNMVLAIGEAKLYRKISMPDWAISFQYVYPVINLILGFGNGIVVNIIKIVIALVSLSCLCEFFGCLGMSKWWPLSMAVGLILTIIGIFKLGINIWIIIGIFLILAYLYAHVVTSIRLAKKFDKGILFTIMLILLPGIFQPVLGFER